MDVQNILPARLVHLDLKGAPLCLSYLDKVLPLLKNLGATGILIEYEDTFPYQADLKTICAPHAYSQDDIRQILKLAEDCNLKVIPLVQTFGHLEFVLKHKQYASLREVKKYPMALCPTNPDSLTLVCKMIDQVMKLHPQIKHFHIGCDEVYHLGLCDSCKQKMAQESLTRDQLFFAHVRNVAKHIKVHYSDITVIIWDDMLRYSELPIILNCGLGDLVEPMVWHYLPKFMLPSDLWDNLSAVFPNIWIASAFKGATGPKSAVTNIIYHLDNNTSWLDTVRLVKNKFKNIQGIAITGWQRYDHFAILCELLPQGLPSLALCLRFIQQGILGPDEMNIVSKELKFTSLIPLNPFVSLEIPVCEFPGSDIYQLTIEFVHTEAACNELFAMDGMTAWMHEYNIQRGFINPVHVEPLLGRAIRVHIKWLDLLSYLTIITDSIDAVLDLSSKDLLVGVEEEWRACFITPHIRRLETFMEKARSILYAEAEMVKCDDF